MGGLVLVAIAAPMLLGGIVISGKSIKVDFTISGQWTQMYQQATQPTSTVLRMPLNSSVQAWAANIRLRLRRRCCWAVL
jgi:hypothetical protein